MISSSVSPTALSTTVATSVVVTFAAPVVFNCAAATGFNRTFKKRKKLHKKSLTFQIIQFFTCRFMFDVFRSGIKHLQMKFIHMQNECGCFSKISFTKWAHWNRSSMLIAIVIARKHIIFLVMAANCACQRLNKLYFHRKIHLETKNIIIWPNSLTRCCGLKMRELWRINRRSFAFFGCFGCTAVGSTLKHCDEMSYWIQIQIDCYNNTMQNHTKKYLISKITQFKQLICGTKFFNLQWIIELINLFLPCRSQSICYFSQEKDSSLWKLQNKCALIELTFGWHRFIWFGKTK